MRGVDSWVPRVEIEVGACTVSMAGYRRGRDRNPARNVNPMEAALHSAISGAISTVISRADAVSGHLLSLYGAPFVSKFRVVNLSRINHGLRVDKELYHQMHLAKSSVTFR